MNKFYLLVGIAGCGKSTWAQDNKGKLFDAVFSSDEYRKKILGSESNQSNNELVFNTMHKDVINALKDGMSVCYDATNITRKSRRNILNLIKDNKIDCEKIAVLFEIEDSIIRKQNSERERQVPEYVINRMLKQFEIPFLGEGFNTIDIVFRQDSQPFKAFVEPIQQMNGFDQDNPHHSQNLLNHCMSCYGNLLNKGVTDMTLLSAGLLHDYGKLFTKEYDEEKGYSHFIGHESYGAYKSLFLDYSPFTLVKEKVAFYINYHMEPYRLVKAKPNTLEKYKNLFGDEWDNLILLHNADDSAH